MTRVARQAAQQFMEQSARPLCGMIPNTRLGWRLTPTRLQIGTVREQTALQLAQLLRDRTNNRERESHAARETALRDHQP